MLQNKSVGVVAVCAYTTASIAVGVGGVGAENAVKHECRCCCCLHYNDTSASIAVGVGGVCTVNASKQMLC